MNAILFDLGNVLIRYDHARTLEAVAALYGAEPARLRQLYAEIGPPFGLGEITSEQFGDFLNDRLGAAVPLDALSAAFCAGLFRDEDALAYVSTLQIEDRVVAGAISNTNALHVAWLDANVPELNEFELVMMSNEVGLLKPDPEIFELALELLNLSASEVLYVDDLAENTEAAQSQGMSTILHTDWDTTRLAIEVWRKGMASQ